MKTFLIIIMTLILAGLLIATAAQESIIIHMQKEVIKMDTKIDQLERAVRILVQRRFF